MIDWLYEHSLCNLSVLLICYFEAILGVLLGILICYTRNNNGNS